MHMQSMNLASSPLRVGRELPETFIDAGMEERLVVRDGDMTQIP